MAIRYGADAVYCAGKRFGLRAGNSNFSDEELKEAVEFVHAHGKKSMLHVISFLIMRDFEGLEDYLKFLESIGVDAIIVADMGIFSLAKRVAPGLRASRKYNKHLLQTGIQFKCGKNWVLHV